MNKFNTKLSKDEKSDLNVIQLEQKDVKIFANGKTTIAYKIIGNGMREFATSVCHSSETKYRAKVGEYNARCRFEQGKRVVLTMNDFCDLLDILDMSAR